MRFRCLLMKAAMATLSYFVIGCSLSEQNAKKTTPVGFITTPASYYSSAKARYLGAKYKENLDRLAERIVRNPKTANLQFANNISSVGGIGFFTHSATNTPDERYLEVIVSAPQSFEKKEIFNTKVARIFAAYGAELLSILAGDPAIYQENEVSGYGLNLTWRSLVQGSTGSGITLEGAVMYFSKETVRAFLHQDIDQNNFLTRAIIFAAEENGPLNLISYRQPDPGPDTRLPIHEEPLSVPQIDAQTESGSLSQPRIEAARETAPPLAVANDERLTSSARVVPITAARQQSADGKGQGQVAINKSPQPAIAFEAPIVQPPLVPSKTQPARTVEPTTTKRTESTSVTKRPDEQSDLHKAEQQANASQVSKADRFHQIKPSKDERKSASGEMSAPKNGGPGTEIPKAATTNKAQSQGAIGEQLASETSRVAGKSGDEKKAAALSKTTSEAQAFPVKAAQPEAKNKFEPLTSEQVALARKNSVAGSQETPRQIVSALPTQGSRVEIAKPLPNPVTKKPARDDPQNEEIVEAAPLSTDADKSARGKNHEAAVVAKSTVKAPSLAPLPAKSTAKENSPPLRAKLPNEQIGLLLTKPSGTAPEKRAVARSRPKALEGYIIQVGFNNKNDAQRWAETLERRGYAVSVTQADGAGSVRLRLGNFSVRDEAERQLKSLKQEGLSGIVINLPQAYRPEVPVPASEESQPQSVRTNN
jgi:cell division protein FtsN